MTENINGTPFQVAVTADASPLFSGSPPARDAVIVVNLTPGLVVYVNDGPTLSREYPALAGKRLFAPFASGQIYAWPRATTAAGEGLTEAVLEVRPVRVDSALARSLGLTLSTINTRLGGSQTSCSRYDPDVSVPVGTSLSGDYAPVSRVRDFDLTGQTLEVRNVETGEEISWISPAVLFPGEMGKQALRLDLENVPADYTLFDVIADPAGVKMAVLRGRARGL